MNELKGKRILFFVPENNVQSNPVYASQVGELAKYVTTLGAECLIFQSATTITENVYDIAPYVHILNDLLPRKKVFFFNVGNIYKKIIEYYNKELSNQSVSVLQHFSEKEKVLSSGHLYLVKLMWQDEEYRNEVCFRRIYPVS